MKKESLFADGRRSHFTMYSDWVFHAVYASDTTESRQALIAVLNVILQRDEDPIREIQVLNPVHYEDRYSKKSAVLDIKALTDHREIIDIEMQSGDLDFYVNRSLCYCGKLVSSSLEKGQDYDKMKKSIVISIVSGTLFPDSSLLHTVFHFREITEHFCLSTLAEMHFLELDKVFPLKAVESMDPVEQLAAYIRLAGDAKHEEKLDQLIRSGGEAVRMTEKLFRELTEDQLAYERRLQEETYEHVMATRLSVAEKRGLESGIQQGIMQIAQNMKKKGFSSEEIAELTGLTLSEAEEL